MQKVGWTYNDQWYYRDGMREDTPIVAYASRDRAEAERVERERRERFEAGSPLEHGPDLEWCSGLNVAEFLRHLETIGVPVPEVEPGETPYWRDWWEMVEDDLTEEQRHAIWDVMGRVRLFEVIEVDVLGGE